MILLIALWVAIGHIAWTGGLRTLNADPTLDRSVGWVGYLVCLLLLPLLWLCGPLVYLFAWLVERFGPFRIWHITVTYV